MKKSTLLIAYYLEGINFSVPTKGFIKSRNRQGRCITGRISVKLRYKLRTILRQVSEFLKIFKEH